MSAPADLPRNVFSEPVVIKPPDPSPMEVLLDPEVTASKAKAPTAVV